MDNLPFFQEENKDLLYNLCKDEIYREKQYNIDESRKYYKTFGEIMKIVYKHSQNKHDLTSLNKEVLSKTIPYLNNEIQSKKLKSEPLVPPNVLRTQRIRSSQMLVNSNPNSNNSQSLPISFRPQSTPIEQKQDSSVSQNYESMMSSRDSLFPNSAPLPVDFSLQSNNNLASTDELLQRNIQERKAIDTQFDLKPNQNQLDNVNQGIDSNQVSGFNTNSMSQGQVQGPFNNQNMSHLKNMKSQDGSVPQLPSSPLEVQDFSISDNMVSRLHQNPDENSNIITDMNTYQPENNNIDPNILLQKMEEENKKQDTEYLKIHEQRIKFEEQNREANLNLELGEQQHQLSQELQENKFQDSMTFKIEEQMNQINVSELKGQLDKKSEEFNRDNLPKANDLNIIQDNYLLEENKVFQEIKKHLFKERKYVNKENLIIINSADRNWYNQDHEHRYSFQVRFNPEPDGMDRVPVIENNVVKRVDGMIVYENKNFKGYQGAGIQTIFKNIVSFEIIRVLMPVENFVLPFENRFHIDYKSLPYIVLNIDEIEGLYGGTNSNTNKAFAQLLWDKDQTAEVVTDTGLLANGKTYARQVKRGFSSMAPMSFEKKTFYPTPLSSLDRLTISMETPYGTSIKNFSDTLDITTIKLIRNNQLLEGNIAAEPERFLLASTSTNTDNGIITLRKEFVSDKNLPSVLQFVFSNDNFDGRTFTIKGLKSDNTDVTEDVTASNNATGETKTTTNSYIRIYDISINNTDPNAEETNRGPGTVKIGVPTIVNSTRSLEVIPSEGFPNANDKNYYLEITTSTGFSNRVFKLGDNIVIKLKEDSPPLANGFTDNNVDFIDFIQRDSGHFIINLEKETSSNQGYITKIYIAPPGNFDETATTPGMVASSLHTQTSNDVTVIDANAFPKLINKSLQTHLTFKVVTREEDIHSYMVSSNI